MPHDSSTTQRGDACTRAHETCRLEELRCRGRRQGWTQVEAQGGLHPPPPPRSNIYSNYIFYFCSWAPLLPNQPSQSNLNSNYSTQKLNKNNKNIRHRDSILAKKLFYHQRTKKSCIIGEAKAKFYATTVNQYKYQLTVAIKIKYNILLRLYLFLQLKNSNSLFLCYFK